MKTSLLPYFIKFRRGISAVCAGIAVLLLIGTLTATDSQQTQILVAAHDLAPGTQITAGDVVDAHMAAKSAWEGLFNSPRQAIGQTTSHAISVGHPLSRDDIVNTDMLRGLASNKVAVEIPASQISNISMLQTGNHIDLYSANRDSDSVAVLIAHDVVVLARGSSTIGSSHMSASSSSGMNSIAQTTAVMVAASPSQAMSLAAHMTTNQLVAVLLTS